MKHLVRDFEKSEKVATRDGFGKGLVKLARRNKKVVSLCCDLTDSTRVAWFASEFPKRFVEVGVAEQNMMCLASGFAHSGKIPFVSSYAVFSPGRNWDQLRTSVCYSNEHVIIEGGHAGITVGPDGATHQALEDIAITRCLPNMTVVVPCDALEAEKATMASAKENGPVYLRVGRQKVITLTTNKTPFQIGKAELFRSGTDIGIIACGIMVKEAMIAAIELKKHGISAAVLNCHTIKPIDKQAIIRLAKKTKAIITAEEHQVHGGLGSAVSEVLSEHYPTKIKIIGVKDHFGESGAPDQLLKKAGLTFHEIVKQAKKLR